MCHFVSGMINQDGHVRFGVTDSHANIIAFHDLHVDGAHGPNWVPWEFLPPSGDLVAPLDKWTYHTDLPQSQWPDWYDICHAELRARHAIKQSRIAQALAEYEKVKAPALAEYEKVKAPAWAEYEKVRESIAKKVW